MSCLSAPKVIPHPALFGMRSGMASTRIRTRIEINDEKIVLTVATDPETAKVSSDTGFVGAMGSIFDKMLRAEVE